ncbi:MAG: hypothetical protein HWN67_05015 [Candidatus Helarchaeota archaeon]|nr:hypothetical protein [Candidatus Helarchaeota archaeon]
MRKKIILTCLFLGFFSLMLIASCIKQPAQPLMNFGISSDLGSENMKASNEPIPFEPPDALINLEVKRSVVFRQSLTHVDDFFAVKNNKTNSKDFIQVGLINTLRTQLHYISAMGKNIGKLRVVELPYDGSGFSKWNLYLDDPIKPDEIFNFTLSMIFLDVVDFDTPISFSGSDPIYRFSFYKYPSSPYLSKSVSGRFYSADDNSIYSTEDLASWDYQSHTGSFTVKNPILECEFFHRQIEIERWGYLYIREYYQLRNIVVNNKVSTFSVLLPIDIIDYKVYDFFTDLIVTPIPEPQHLAINLTINWDISRYTLDKDQSAFFWVEYRRPLELHNFESGSIGRFFYQFEPERLPWRTHRFLTTFELPPGCSIISHVPTASSVITASGDIYLNYLTYNATSSQYKVFMFDYVILDTLPFDFYRPLLIAGLISIPLISFIILKRELPRKKELRLRPTEVPSHVIREFITLYSEKNALYIEIENLEENMARRKIKKREYRNQLKTIERKLSGLNKELQKFSDEINEAGGRYTKIIEDLELREADYDMAREALEAIERRYRISRRISTTTYRKLKKEEEKALQKAKKDKEKLIQELRELMG